MTTTESVRKELKMLEDPTYREFHSSLIPGANNILGVRIPQLRIMAKGLAKKEDWRTFVEATDTQYYGCTKLLQKREMRKDIVIELSYKGFSRASDYS